MPSRPIDARIVAAVLACGLSLAVAGCARKSVHAGGPPSTAPVPAEAQRPMNTAPDTNAAPPVEAVVPPAVPATSTAPPPIAMPSAKPSVPHKPVGEPAAADADSEPSAHPAAPQISPQLSPGDQASYARKTGDDIAVAERNLGQASGKQLSAAQQDLVEKIRSFVSQSRDASKSGDWARAQNLAQKARLLSVELLNSL
ncbi:MAG: hypothetical protein ABR973_02675 [Candidatus Acidiferrales bacterium]|jgi:hypothetical protein